VPEVVAHAGERLDRFGRQAVQFAGRVAQPPGQVPAHLEVEPAVRLLRDRLVHGLDLVSQFADVYLGHHVLPSAGRGYAGLVPVMMM